MMTKKELEALDARIEAELKASKMSEGYKQSLKERAIIREQELSEIRAIRGLDEGTGKKRQKIMLPNGMKVNADAFDEWRSSMLRYQPTERSHSDENGTK